MKILFTNFLILFSLIFANSLFAKEPICIQIETMISMVEVKSYPTRNEIEELESKLRAVRTKIDGLTGSIWSFDLGSLPQRQELHKWVQMLEDTKKELQTAKDELRPFTSQIEQLNKDLAAAGCTAPPVTTGAKPQTPSPAKPTSPPQELLPNWVGSYRGPCTYEDFTINLKQTSDVTMEVTQTGPQNLRLSAAGSPQPVDMVVTSDPATAKGTLSTRVGGAASGGGADMNYTAVLKGDVLLLSMASTNEGHINMNGLQAAHKGSSKMTCTMTRVE